jgi:hypothetical protein
VRVLFPLVYDLEMLDAQNDDAALARFKHAMLDASRFGAETSAAILFKLRSEVSEYIRDREELLAVTEPPPGLADVWGDVALPARDPHRTWARLKQRLLASVEPFRKLLAEMDGR